MAKKSKGHKRFGWPDALILATLFIGAAALASAGEVNVIKRIRTVQSGVEIELSSTTAFLQSDLPMLRIGDQEFTLSRYPDDGDLKTLIFKLTSDQFNKTASGDPVTFQYGRGERRAQRDFGRLDKSQLDK